MVKDYAFSTKSEKDLSEIPPQAAPYCPNCGHNDAPGMEKSAQGEWQCPTCGYQGAFRQDLDSRQSS